MLHLTRLLTLTYFRNSRMAYLQHVVILNWHGHNLSRFAFHREHSADGEQRVTCCPETMGVDK